MTQDSQKPEGPIKETLSTRRESGPDIKAEDKAWPSTNSQKPEELEAISPEAKSSPHSVEDGEQESRMEWHQKLVDLLNDGRNRLTEDDASDCLDMYAHHELKISRLAAEVERLKDADRLWAKSHKRASADRDRYRGALSMVENEATSLPSQEDNESQGIPVEEWAQKADAAIDSIVEICAEGLALTPDAQKGAD